MKPPLMREADFDDREQVLEEVSAEIAILKRELLIDRVSRMASDGKIVPSDDVIYVVTRAPSDNRRWIVFRDRLEQRGKAIAFAANSLETRPSNFLGRLSYDGAFRKSAARRAIFAAIGEDSVRYVLECGWNRSHALGAVGSLPRVWLDKPLDHLPAIKNYLGKNGGPDYYAGIAFVAIQEGGKLGVDGVVLRTDLFEVAAAIVEHSGPENILSAGLARHSRETPSGFTYYLEFEEVGREDEWRLKERPYGFLKSITRFTPIAP